MENSPRPNLPSPATPLQKSAFSFDDKDLLTPKSAKSPLKRSPSFLSKISAEQRRKLAEKEAIDELDNEALRVKTSNLDGKSKEPFSSDDLNDGEKRLYIGQVSH